MARRTVQQLEFPMSLVEGVTLREQVQSLERTCEDQQYQLYEAWSALDVLTTQRNTLQQECDAARAEVQSLQFQLRATRLLLDLQSDRSSTAPGALPIWLAQELRKLLVMSHPDRWSGQSAEVLAHEVAVAVNALRQRLGEGTR